MIWGKFGMSIIKPQSMKGPSVLKHFKKRGLFMSKLRTKLSFSNQIFY